jgi:pimeloyl-ACP methyl ester carboxylesterase
MNDSWLVWASAVVLVGGVCVGCSESAEESRAGGSGGAGGEVPPAGTLLSYEPRAALGMKLWTVRYTSRGIDGAPIEVTGMVAAPEEAPGGELRDVVSMAHGTTGVSDPCAPSTMPLSGFFLDVTAAALDAGYVLAATDYEGLGTPGLHPYYVRESEGRGVVDIVRAARQLEEAHSGSRVVVWGTSQGGHGALSTGEVGPGWAPDVELLGVVAAAPGSELPVTFTDGPGAAGTRGYLWQMTLGFEEDYPGLRIDDLYEPETLQTIRGLVEAEACNGEFLDAARFVENAGLATNPVDIPAWLEVLETNSPGNVRSEMPILLIQGSEDPVVLQRFSDALFERLCETGSVTDYRVIEGAGHGAFGENLPMVVEWTEERFAGAAATDTCP